MVKSIRPTNQQINNQISQQSNKPTYQLTNQPNQTTISINQPNPYPGYLFGPLMTICRKTCTFHGVTPWGKVNLEAKTMGMPISLVAMYGSGEMTERAAKLTRFPIMCIRNRPAFFSTSCIDNNKMKNDMKNNTISW